MRIRLILTSELCASFGDWEIKYKFTYGVTPLTIVIRIIKIIYISQLLGKIEIVFDFPITLEKI